MKFLNEKGLARDKDMYLSWYQDSIDLPYETNTNWFLHCVIEFFYGVLCTTQVMINDESSEA